MNTIDCTTQHSDFKITDHNQITSVISGSSLPDSSGTDEAANTTKISKKINAHQYRHHALGYTLVGELIILYFFFHFIKKQKNNN